MSVATRLSSSSLRTAAAALSPPCRSRLQCPSSSVFLRRATVSALKSQTSQPHTFPDPPRPANTVRLDSQTSLSNDATAPQTAARPPPVPKAEKPRRTLRATKAALTMTPTAVERIGMLLHGPTPQLIRVGVRNKGCAGMSYHLEYVEKPGKFDEIVEQDGVRVLIDSKALFSIIGSEMDWKEDSLSSKFVFNNPNVKDACGCGESFNIST
ncbi:iron sulfur assembly protein 1 [Coprinopsis marcescibilis]|uniref:Iron-sulfur assembly protein 1 n=1 Tax=Coprinopsis marcescibilis TaxID=230819 RepID=A0A5C3LEU5_COPMA|nr:iron sulfur assembly protein 1 [Coprinopsis marcescibilis]